MVPVRYNDAVVLVAVFLSGCGGGASWTEKDQHSVWYSKDRSAPFSTRLGKTVTLHPSNATLSLPDAWLNWYESSKNNLHLSRAELESVAKGQGAWDSRYASVCNAVFPFDKCAAHLADEGWGAERVSVADLQMRVYVVSGNLSDIQDQIVKAGAKEAKTFANSSLKISQDGNDRWKRVAFSYRVRHGGMLGRGCVDFRFQAIEKTVFVFVFMYMPDSQAQEAIDPILSSFKMPE